MSHLFVCAVNMSISATYVLAAVLVLRLLLKRAPRFIFVILWGMVAFRLICPLTVESIFSLMPKDNAVSIGTEESGDVSYSDTDVPSFDWEEIPIGSSPNTDSLVPESSVDAVTKDSEDKRDVPLLLLSTAWAGGMALLLLYAFVSYRTVKKSVKDAICVYDNVYVSRGISSPFVLFIVRPKIYIPESTEERDRVYVIAHEEAHIRRKDHLWKPFGFLLLIIHWFNPFMWLGYILLCRDVELACDERVIKELHEEERADYSEALLNSGSGRRMISACPLAFGEVGVKARVKSVLSYKRPAFWIILLALLSCIAVAVCFLTDPHTDEADGDKEKSDLAEEGDGEDDPSGADENKERIYGSVDTDKMTEEQKRLFESYPEYFGLDVTNGLEIYVWQLAAKSYSFAIYSYPRGASINVGDTSLMFPRAISALGVRSILETYPIDTDDIHITLGSCLYSSYHSPWNVLVGDDTVDKARREAYAEMIWAMIKEGYNPNGLSEITVNDADLIYSSAYYDYVYDFKKLLPVEIKDGGLYSKESGRLIGALSEVTLNYYEFLDLNKDSTELALIKGIYFDKQLVYEVTPIDNELFYASAGEGIGLYYVMIQANGDILFVYGHYENGQRTDYMRWIYKSEPAERYEYK